MPPGLRELAVRILLEQQGQHRFQWAAMKAKANRVGCTAETLRKWVRHSETSQGKRDELSSSEREQLKEMKRENREPQRKASHFFPGRNSTDPSDEEAVEQFGVPEIMNTDQCSQFTPQDFLACSRIRVITTC